MRGVMIGVLGWLLMCGGGVAWGCPLEYGDVVVSSVVVGSSVLVEENVSWLGQPTCGVGIASRSAVRVRAVPRVRLFERVVPRSAIRVRVHVR